jgi:hypothetical protein
MSAWKISAVGVTLGLGAIVGAEHAQRAWADAREPHVMGTLQNLRSAQRHLEALPRSDKRDLALSRTQEALKATEEIPNK